MKRPSSCWHKSFCLRIELAFTFSLSTHSRSFIFSTRLSSLNYLLKTGEPTKFNSYEPESPECSIVFLRFYDQLVGIQPRTKKLEIFNSWIIVLSWPCWSFLFHSKVFQWFFCPSVVLWAKWYIGNPFFPAVGCDIHELNWRMLIFIDHSVLRRQIYMSINWIPSPFHIQYHVNLLSRVYRVWFIARCYLYKGQSLMTLSQHLRENE